VAGVVTAVVTGWAVVDRAITVRSSILAKYAEVIVRPGFVDAVRVGSGRDLAEPIVDTDLCRLPLRVRDRCREQTSVVIPD
jgi:hypothetical protein